MKNESIIFNIHSKYNLKLVFSYLDYQYILKLVKYNKRFQAILGIKLDNYKNNSNYLKYNLQKEKDYGDRNLYYSVHKKPMEFNGESELGICCLVFCFTCIYFIYILVYSILLVTKDSFNYDNSSKENYKEKSNTIDKINLSLFSLIASILFATIVFIVILCKEEHDKKGWKSIIKKILLILLNLILILFESLIIWKLVLSYEIKTGGVTWFMIMDYIFIILNFLYILFILGMTYIYFHYYVIHYNDYFYNTTSYFITSLNNITIKKFKVSEDFLEMGEKDKTKYLLDNYKNMVYINTEEEKNLITSVNEFRVKHNLPEFGIRYSFKLPKYIMKEHTDMMINPEQNFFIVGNKKYLFRYNVSEFEKNFKSEEPNILSVLLKEELNYINIINKDNIEYILIY